MIAPVSRGRWEGEDGEVRCGRDGRAVAERVDGRSRERRRTRRGPHSSRRRRSRGRGLAAYPRLRGIRAGEPINGQRILVAVTDGERDAAITVTLTNTLILELGIKGEHTSTYVIERISRAASGSFEADDRYEEVLLAHRTRSRPDWLAPLRAQLYDGARG